MPSICLEYSIQEWVRLFLVPCPLRFCIYQFPEGIVDIELISTRDFLRNTSVRLGRPHWLGCQSLRSIWSNGFRISSHRSRCLNVWLLTVPLRSILRTMIFAHSDCLLDLLGWLSSEILRLHVQGLMMMHCWRLIPQFDHTIWSLHLVAVV